MWLSDAALCAWQAPPSGRPGGQRRYADIAIEAALTIRMVFHLPLRQTEGFLRSLAELLDVNLPIPDHTTLSRRLQRLDEIHFHRSATQGPLHLLIDSTGLRIHVGHLRKPPRNRAWRKLHLAVDANSGQIVASELTNHRIRDSTPVSALLEQTDQPLASLCADGTYDRKSVYEAAQRKGNPRAPRSPDLLPTTKNLSTTPSHAPTPVKDQTCTVSSAGMPPVTICRASTGEVQEVEVSGFPLGLSATATYDEESFEVTPGDVILMMTDGLPERLNPLDEYFDYDRTKELFAEAASGTPEEICETLLKACEDWAEGRPQDDDITLVVLKAK